MNPLYYNNDLSCYDSHYLDKLTAPYIDPMALLCTLKAKTVCRFTPPSYDKNYRFPDIVCPEETRIQLPESEDGFYLHANHVTLEKNHFIATQYPLPEQVPLFWHAAKKASLILDLTNENDMKQGLNPYYPAFGKQQEFNGLTIKCASKQTFKNIYSPIYNYSITEPSDTPPHQISRLHFTEWNDHDGITEDQIDQLLAVMEYYRKDSSSPILIHCRAGVGRTGTLIVAYALQTLINQKKIDASNLLENLCRLILEGREQRGPEFVQSAKQILALWKWSWQAAHRPPTEPKFFNNNFEYAPIVDEVNQHNDDGTINPNWLVDNPHASLMESGITNYEMLIEFLKKHGPLLGKSKSLNLRGFNLTSDQTMEVLKLCNALG